LANGPAPELQDSEFLRRVDAIRFHPDVPLTPWLEALSRGFHLPLVAGSGKDSNRGQLGSWRTYAQLDQPLDYAAWIEAIRGGRTFVTNGPILKVSRAEKIVVEAFAAAPLDRLEVFNKDGLVAAITGPSITLRLETEADDWLVARCVAADGTMAVSSPRSKEVK
jgi:hypothetical protein